MFPVVSPYLALAIYLVCIPLRLLCNLFDGMVAVEHNKKSPNGILYNDVTDRFSDAFLIVPAGYVAGGFGVELAWLAALLAVATAYVRWIGVYKSGEHYFSGPAAKPHRMFVLMAAAAISLAVQHLGYAPMVFLVALMVMNVLLAVTIVNRLCKIARKNRE
jgi:phosphatidylglycerophosphate synthase